MASLAATERKLVHRQDFFTRRSLSTDRDARTQMSATQFAAEGAVGGESCCAGVLIYREHCTMALLQSVGLTVNI